MAAITPEKHDEYVVHDEAVGSDGQTTPPQRELVHFDEKEERKLIRKIDRRLLPILGALYAVAIIDRVNVGLLHPQAAASDSNELPTTDLGRSNFRYGRRLEAIHRRPLYHRVVRVFPALSTARIPLEHYPPKGRTCKVAVFPRLRLGHRHARPGRCLI